MRVITASVGPLATASANAICLSQTPTLAFTLNGALASGGVATLDTLRRVLFTAVANESARTITLVGTDRAGQVQSELIAGPNATTTYSVLDYATVTSITISPAAAGAITVGTNTVASTAWIRLDEWAQFPTSLQATVTGTANYTIQQAMQDPNSSTNPVAPYQVMWINSPDSSVVTATTTQQSNYTYAPVFTRLLLNSGTGSVTYTVSQSGSVTQ